MRYWSIGTAFLFLIWSYDARACNAAEASFLGNIEVEIGFWDAFFAAGNYRRAAYDELGEVLEDQHGSVPAGSYFFNFHYNLNFGPAQPGFIVTICVNKDSSQSWEEVIDDHFQRIRENTPIFRADIDEVPNAPYNYSDHLMAQTLAATRFPAGARIVVGGGMRGIVTCEPACF